MKANLVEKLSNNEKKLLDIEDKMSANSGNWSELSKAHGQLLPIVSIYREWKKTKDNLDELQPLLSDNEMKDLAREEIRRTSETLAQIENNIYQMLSPEAAENARDCFIEIRAAVGGNESCLFAADLLRMYWRYAENNGWRVEVLSVSDGEVGGYKEVIAQVGGTGAYGRLKFESGAHRVQRIPETESQGRIHTSVATVAVMAVADDNAEINIAPNDLKIDTFRASGAGGQHVNTTDSAVRITHLPTGVVSECQDERSQHKNKDKAMRILKARIIDRQRSERLEKESSERRLLVGSGDRSDRIRTYNFPQGRMTDHRVGLTLYKLPQIMEGDLDELLDTLNKEDEADRIANT